MNKKLLLTIALAGLIPGLICLAQYDVRMVQTNADWHIDSPKPTNVPIQSILLNNGQWAWSTNVEEWWHGIWKEDTNGWRTQLSMAGSWLTVEVGSTVKDADGCFTTPNGKFAKFELLGTNGIALQPKKNGGTNLFGVNGLFYKTNLPTWAAMSAGSLVADFPQTTSINIYPHGNSACSLGFVSNGSPARINLFNLNDVFSITNEGDYTLTVQPVIYSQHIAYLTLNREQLKEFLKKGLHISYYEKNGVIHAETNTDNPVLYRRDFPSITTKVHLKPTP